MKPLQSKTNITHTHKEKKLRKVPFPWIRQKKKLPGIEDSCWNELIPADPAIILFPCNSLDWETLRLFNKISSKVASSIHIHIYIYIHATLANSLIFIMYNEAVSPFLRRLDPSALGVLHCCRASRMKPGSPWPLWLSVSSLSSYFCWNGI